jgi:hypothetical protein
MRWRRRGGYRKKPLYLIPMRREPKAVLFVLRSEILNVDTSRTA